MILLIWTLKIQWWGEYNFLIPTQCHSIRSWKQFVLKPVQHRAYYWSRRDNTAFQQYCENGILNSKRIIKIHIIITTTDYWGKVAMVVRGLKREVCIIYIEVSVWPFWRWGLVCENFYELSKEVVIFFFLHSFMVRWVTHGCGIAGVSSALPALCNR